MTNLTQEQISMARECGADIAKNQMSMDDCISVAANGIDGWRDGIGQWPMWNEEPWNSDGMYEEVLNAIEERAIRRTEEE